jgi:NAD(P)-dependent dehydrogenase (short-subunit alcohol dehydrogenase family)
VKRPLGEQVIVVTGASSGVGRAVARAAGARGARVVVSGRNEEALAAAVAEIEAAGGQALAVAAEATSADEHAALCERAVERFGGIDSVVCAAMVTVMAEVEQLEAEEIRRVLEVNFLGRVHAFHAALPHLKRSHGTFVDVNSALAYRGIPLQAAYCGAKHAIRGFTDSLRTELMHENSGVKITTVHLPALNTTQFGLVRVRMPRKPRPVAPVYQPEVAARAIVWASEHASRREHWVAGSTVMTILGTRLTPGIVGDLYLAKTGFKGQQTDQPVDEHRRETDYLFTPVPGDHGHTGPFGGESKDRSVQVWLAEHRNAIAGAIAAGALGAATAKLTRR